MATVKALACELPSQRGEPLSRYSTAEIARLIKAHPDAPAMSQSTIWRILDRDALKPWRYRSWISPATRSLPRRPVACSTCMPAAGRGSPCTRRTA